MRLTRQSEIAIGMLAICASAPRRKVRTQFLAERTDTTKHHAAQVVSLLSRNGLVASERGRGGGLRLAADPKTIRLADVLQVTQPELVAAEDGSPVPRRSGNSGLDAITESSAAFFHRLMDRFTIADLVVPAKESRVACLDCALMNPLRPTSQALASAGV